MICEATRAIPEILLPAQFALAKPTDSIRTWDWACDHGRMPDGTPFDGERVPWCEGVCDALDDPETKEVALQWGTRLGKTTIGMQWLAKVADTRPMPGLFATSTQSLAKRTVRNKIYPVLDNISVTRGQLPPPHLRTFEEIRLGKSPWAVAWSGSDTQLADLSAFYGYANEIDKWNLDERKGGDAGEGDALDQFEERFKEFPDAKLLFECSPSTRRHSRIERKRLASNNCLFWVPCPMCGKYQWLRFGITKSEADEDDVLSNVKLGGILFDRLEDGTLDPQKARESARYVCAHCAYELYDDQRPKMMRSGVWVPEGCHVDKRGRVKGPARRGNRIWGSQLSSLYSLQLTWGDIAEKFAKVFRHPEQLRMFKNGWLAETWEPYRIKSEPEQVAERLATDVPEGIIPKWATWLFAAVDVQGDVFVYVVLACGPGERIAVVKHGELETHAEIKASVITKKFEHADGGPALWPAATAVDCGFRTKQQYEFCKSFDKTPHKVVPIKGANSDCAGEPYEIKIIGVNEGQSTRTKKALIRAGRGLRRIRVSPYFYEPIIQEQLDDLLPEMPGSLALNEQAATDADYVRQLCNGAESSMPSKADPNRHLWVKRWENEPNDYRDAVKYCRCIMDWFFKRNWRRAEQRQVIHSESQQAKSSPKEAASSGRRSRRERVTRTRERIRSRRR